MITSGAWLKVVAPLRERDFRLLWSGNLVSLLGDGIFTVALALEALRVDHQPTGLAYVLACRAVPAVALAIVGGVVVDRIPRRTAVLVADLVRGAAVGLIAILVVEHAIGLWELAVMAVAFGMADAFAGPAFLAVIPELLPAELITQANALNSTSAELAVNLIGPAVGGLAVAAIGTAAAFGFDAATFAVSAGCLAGLRWRYRPGPSGKSLLAEVAEGIHYIVSRRWLFLLLMGAAVANLVGMGPYVVLLRHVLHASPVVLGLVYASAGAAGVAASLVVARPRVAAAPAGDDVECLQRRRDSAGGDLLRAQRLGHGPSQRGLGWADRLRRHAVLHPAPNFGPQASDGPGVFSVVGPGLDPDPGGHDPGRDRGRRPGSSNGVSPERALGRRLWPGAAGARRSVARSGAGGHLRWTRPLELWPASDPEPARRGVGVGVQR